MPLAAGKNESILSSQVSSVAPDLLSSLVKLQAVGRRRVLISSTSTMIVHTCISTHGCQIIKTVTVSCLVRERSSLRLGTREREKQSNSNSPKVSEAKLVPRSNAAAHPRKIDTPRKGRTGGTRKNATTRSNTTQSRGFQHTPPSSRSVSMCRPHPRQSLWTARQTSASQDPPHRGE